jgi:glycosyltransferase involved in cell wall biosynthesis
MRIVKPGGIVIPNVVQVPLTVTHTKNNIFTWLCVAHFRNSKDYETLFKAIHLIKDKKFIVNIIGKLHGQTWPFETVKNLGIEEHINILGFLNEPEPYFNSADAFVLSSKWEGSPNAMLEAMASERLVVGSAIGGIRELITEADCGILFKQGDEQELAAAMAKVMNMAENELKLAGDNGRKYIIDNFSEQVVLHKWEDIILKGFKPAKK